MKYQIRQYEKIKALKEKDIELDEHILGDEFRKIALQIVSAQKRYSKTGKATFKLPFERTNLPGVSPVSRMINGEAPEMLYKGYRQQYSYRNNIGLPSLTRASKGQARVIKAGSTDAQNTCISIRKPSLGSRRRVQQSENDYNPFATHVTGARDLKIGEPPSSS